MRDDYIQFKIFPKLLYEVLDFHQKEAGRLNIAHCKNVNLFCGILFTFSKIEK